MPKAAKRGAAEKAPAAPLRYAKKLIEEPRDAAPKTSFIGLKLADGAVAREVQSPIQKGPPMRVWFAALAVALAACSGQKEAGPIGQTIDLRQYLPDSLRAIALTASDSTFHRQIRVGPDSAPVDLVWTRFRHGPGRYLGTVGAQLLAPVHYDSLTIGKLSHLGNVGTKDTVIASATVRVEWFKTTLFVHRAGGVDFGFTGRGR